MLPVTSSLPLPSMRKESPKEHAASTFVAQVKNVVNSSDGNLVGPAMSCVNSSRPDFQSDPIALTADEKYYIQIREHPHLRNFAPHEQNTSPQIRVTNLGFAVTAVYNLASEGAGKSFTTEICEKYPRGGGAREADQEDPAFPRRGGEFLKRMASTSETHLDTTIVATGLGVGHRLKNHRVYDADIANFNSIIGARIGLLRKMASSELGEQPEDLRLVP